MKLCRNGLYLISSEKGYLCYYPLEKPPNPKNKITQLQILEMAVNSNIVYVSTTDMSENLIFKLRLSNKPSIT